MTAIVNDRSTALAREKRRMWRTTRLAWMLLLPSFIFLAMFTFYPIGYSIWNSLYKDNNATIRTGPVYIGLKNYITLFTKDQIFKQAFINNVIVAVVTVPISLGLAIMMAIFMGGECRGVSYRNKLANGKVAFLLHVKGTSEEANQHMELRYYCGGLHHLTITEAISPFVPNNVLDNIYKIDFDITHGSTKYPLNTMLTVILPQKLPFTPNSDDMLAVFVDGDDLFVFEELDLRLVTRFQLCDAESFFRLEYDPLNIVLRQHRMFYGANRYSNGVAFTGYDRNVLLLCSIRGVGLKYGHFLSAAHRRARAVLEYDGNLAAGVAANEL